MNCNRSLTLSHLPSLCYYICYTCGRARARTYKHTYLYFHTRCSNGGAGEGGGYDEPEAILGASGTTWLAVQTGPGSPAPQPALSLPCREKKSQGVGTRVWSTKERDCLRACVHVCVSACVYMCMCVPVYVCIFSGLHPRFI